VLRDADQSLADQSIVWVGPRRRLGAEPLRQYQSGAMPIAGGVKDLQARERAQLVFCVIKILCNLKDPCPGRTGLGVGT
jgi:hypothetical protein